MKRAFISFDFDHDEKLRDALKGQARNPDSPFNIADWSLREPFTGNWKAKVRKRIRRTDIVIVLCGEYTHTADGVAAEVTIAREEDKPYFLLKGRRCGTCMKPSTARVTDEIHEWTWENLRKQIEGKTPLDSLTSWILVGGLMGLAIWIGRRKLKESLVQVQRTPGVYNRNRWT